MVPFSFHVAVLNANSDKQSLKHGITNAPIVADKQPRSIMYGLGLKEVRLRDPT